MFLNCEVMYFLHLQAVHICRAVLHVHAGLC